MAKDKKDDTGVEMTEYDMMKKRLAGLKTKLELGRQHNKVRSKHNKVRNQLAMKEGSTMSKFDDAISKLASLNKESFVPADQVAGGAPPMDPAMMDPAMMMAGGGGGAPPMDPAMMGGMPPMDPAMLGMDPAMMGGMPPMDPAAAGGAPPPAAPPGEDPATRPATMADVSIVEERIKALEGLMKDMIETMDTFGASVESKETETPPEGDQELAGAMGQPVTPGPLGGGDPSVMGQMRANPTENQLINTLNELQNVNAG